MMWYWGPGYGWGMALFGMLMMLVFWGGIIAVVVWLGRLLVSTRPAPIDTALETLRTRLAGGEISPEEFERIRKTLRS